MTRAVGNGMIQTLANAIGTGAVGKLAKQVAGLSTDMANIKAPDKGSGLMFDPETGKLYIPCGNGLAVNESTGMLEVTIGENLRRTHGGLDAANADETAAGVVKPTNAASELGDEKRAATADGVRAYAPGYGTKPADVKTMVTLANGTVYTAQVAGGVFFAEIGKDATWAAGETAIALSGYGVSGDSVYCAGVGGCAGAAATRCAFDCSNGEGALEMRPRHDIADRELHIAIPVYKL